MGASQSDAACGGRARPSCSAPVATALVADVARDIARRCGLVRAEKIHICACVLFFYTSTKHSSQWSPEGSPAEPFLALAAHSRFKYLKRPLIGV